MAESTSSEAHTEEMQSLKPGILSERDKWIVKWLSKNLVLQQKSKVEVKQVCKRVQRELGEAVPGNVIGKCLRFVFGSRVKNFQDSKRVRCYYGVKFLLEEVDGRDKEGVEMASKSQAEAENEIAVGQDKEQVDHAKLESVRFRTAINLYRNERMEKEKLQSSLEKEKELSKYSKSLQLPSSMFLNNDELVEVPDSKKHAGTFGSCCLFTYRGMDVAVKAYHELEGFSDDAMKRLVLREANVLLNLHAHRGIPKLLGVVIESKPYHLVTSFHGISRESTTIKEILKIGSNKIYDGLPTKKEEWWKVFASLADVLLHVHTTGYVHGDIKTDNVLVEAGMSAVIVDFGKSVLSTKSKLSTIPSVERDEYKLKYPWVAPEIVNGIKPLSRESDIYAYGCLVSKVVKTTKLKSKRLHQIISNTVVPDADKRICLTRIQNILCGYF